MGIVETKTGKVIRENKKSKTLGTVEKITIKENEGGEQEMKVQVDMLDL